MRIVPAWTRTVGDLKAEGTHVHAVCVKCGHSDVDLDAIIKKHGDLFSLWNRSPPCSAKCGSRIFFSAARIDAGVWPTNLRCEGHPDVAQLHQVWMAERAARRRAEEVWGFLRRRRRRRARVREEARKLMMGDNPLRTAAEMMRATLSAEIDLWAEVRLEVEHRLMRARQVDLEADV